MIELYTGTPGSGKSYSAVWLADKYLTKKGEDVICNFDLKKQSRWRGSYIRVQNSELTAAYLVEYAKNYWNGRRFHEDGLLVCLDEAQLIYNSRLWNSDPNRMSFLELLSQHRKFGMRIVLIAQNDLMIDKQFRALVEYESNFRNVGRIGGFGRLLSLLAFGSLFYCLRTYYPTKTKVDGYFVRYSKRIGDMYNSYQTLQMGTAAPAAVANMPVWYDSDM